MLYKIRTTNFHILVVSVRRGVASAQNCHSISLTCAQRQIVSMKSPLILVILATATVFIDAYPGRCGRFKYDNETALCCNKVPLPLDKRPREFTRCCGRALYDIRDRMCCGGGPKPALLSFHLCCNNVTAFAAQPEKSYCCGTHTKENATECCDGKVHESLRNQTWLGCCGENVYDTGEFTCKNGRKHITFIGDDCTKDSKRYLCCDNKIKGEKLPFTRCCGGNYAFVNDFFGCCNNKIPYVKIAYCCKNGVLFPGICFDNDDDMTTPASSLSPGVSNNSVSGQSSEMGPNPPERINRSVCEKAIRSIIGFCLSLITYLG